MKDWAASSQQTPVQSVYLRPESTQAAKFGLAGLVKLTQPEPTVTVYAADSTSSTTRQADVTVTWATTSGLTMTQTYRMTLQPGDGNWYILDIRGGTFQ